MPSGPSPEKQSFEGRSLMISIGTCLIDDYLTFLSLILVDRTPTALLAIK